MPRLVRLVLLVAGIAIAAPAAAQSFPSKPVRLVVPNPAGGTVDLLARVLAGRLAERRSSRCAISPSARDRARSRR